MGVDQSYVVKSPDSNDSWKSTWGNCDWKAKLEFGVNMKSWAVLIDDDDDKEEIVASATTVVDDCSSSSSSSKYTSSSSHVGQGVPAYPSGDGVGSSSSDVSSACNSTLVTVAIIHKSTSKNQS